MTIEAEKVALLRLDRIPWRQFTDHELELAAVLADRYGWRSVLDRARRESARRFTRSL